MTLEIIEINRIFTLVKALPPDLKARLLSEEIADILESIQRKNSVADEKFGRIVKVTGRTMMGLLPVKDFVQNIINFTQIEAEKARAIAQDINQLIFQPVRESLMAVHGLKDAEQTRTYAERTQTQTTPTTKAPEPKPLSLQELDKRPQPQPVRPPEPVIPSATQEKANEQRRQELIERLKQSKGEKRVNGRNGARGPTTTLQRGSGQAAWNGRTIDLNKIPPRRETPNNGVKKNGVRYLDPRDLYES